MSSVIMLFGKPQAHCSPGRSTNGIAGPSHTGSNTSRLVALRRKRASSPRYTKPKTWVIVVGASPTLVTVSGKGSQSKAIMSPLSNAFVSKPVFGGRKRVGVDEAVSVMPKDATMHFSASGVARAIPAAARWQDCGGHEIPQAQPSNRGEP